jgi:ABC-type sugar transport system substrate-binding protein
MKASRRHWLGAMTLLASAAAVLAATASSATGAAARAEQAPVTSYKYVSSASAVAAARAAGRKDAGARTALPTGKSIGLILLSAQSPTSIRIRSTAQQIARLLGYRLNVCDPNFDPQKVQQCGTSMVAQNSSLIISVSTNPGAFGSAVQQAAQRGIPWIGVASGATPAAGFTDYGVSGVEMTALFDRWYFATVRTRTGGSGPFKLLALTAPTVGISAVNSDKRLAADLRRQPSFQLTVNHNLDLANIVQDVLNTTKQVLQRHPDLAGVWTYCDLCIPLVAQVVNGEQGASRRTVVAGMYSTPQVISDIRTGRTDGVADYAWEASVWAAVDQALRMWARGARIAPNFGVFKRYSLPFMRPYMITRETARRSGPAPILGPDYATYFTTKWRAEYTGLKG